MVTIPARGRSATALTSPWAVVFNQGTGFHYNTNGTTGNKNQGDYQGGVLEAWQDAQKGIPGANKRLLRKEN